MAHGKLHARGDVSAAVWRAAALEDRLGTPEPSRFGRVLPLKPQPIPEEEKGT
jgi:hypothetical protein